jgi:hypothetical protein
VTVHGRYGYVDTSGTLIIPAQFDSASPFSEERAAVRKEGKWGYLDPSGKVAIPFQFDMAQAFQDGYATVVAESRTAVIDKTGAAVGTLPVTLAQTFQRLQGFEIEPGVEGPLGEILPILAVYKEQLRQLAADTLKDIHDPAAATTAIEAALRRAGVRDSANAERRPYGSLVAEVVQPPLQPDLLSVAFHLNLSQATVTSLSLFEHRGTSWVMMFKVDRGDFNQQWDAYHIAPPQFTASDTNGEFVMLLASDSERGGNGGYGLWVDVYRISGNFDKEPFFHQMFGCKDHQIALDANGFRLETISMEHDATIAGYRVFPYRYEFQGNQAIRIDPIGFDAHDFVGEWGNLPWDEASRWSDPKNLERIHENYDNIRDPDGYFGGEFGMVQTCDPQQKLWQVEYLRRDERDSLYFLLEQKDKWAFIVKDIQNKMLDGCKTVEAKRGGPFSTMFRKPLEW